MSSRHYTLYNRGGPGRSNIYLKAPFGPVGEGNVRNSASLVNEQSIRLEKDIRQAMYLDVIKGLEEGIAEGLQEALNMVAVRAGEKMSQAYKNSMEGEPGDTINKKVFVQADPGPVIAAQRAVVTGGGRKFIGRANENPAATQGGLTGLRSINVSASIIKKSDLDAVPDRKGFAVVKYLVPLLQVKHDANSGKRYLGITESFVVRQMTVKGRNGKAIDPLTKKPWKLWSALEHGNVAGHTIKVMVRSVSAYKRLGGTLKTGGVLVNYDEVKFGNEWMVFMTTNAAYWNSVESITKKHGLDCVRVLDAGYRGGEKPIYSSYVELEGQIKEAINAAVRERIG